MSGLGRKLWGLVVLATVVACAQAAPTAGEASVAPDEPSATLPVTIETPSLAPSETPTEAPTETALPSDIPLPAPGFPDAEAYDWVPLEESFIRPLLVTNAGDGSNRLFIVEQNGKIRVMQNGVRVAEPFLDIDSRVDSESNEQGLLGLAFHPEYEQNGSFYVNYTDLFGNTVVARFQVSADPNVADVGSEQILLEIDQPAPNHNGGNLAFGPDGYLYIGMGDGGGQGDPSGNAQSLDSLLGKMLRIDVNAGSPYGIPADNPYANGGGSGEIWALGFRNPWRFSFDDASGDLYIADVGQGQWEEIDFLPGGIVGGSNLGWDYYEGTHPYEGTPPAGAVLLPPVTEYEHGPNRCSVTGGHVYRGAALPAWQGVYLYADYCSGVIFGLVQQANGAWESRVLYDTSFLVTSFGVDEAGEIYVIDRGGGIYQLQEQ